MTTRTAKRRGSRVSGRSVKVPLAQISLWAPDQRAGGPEPWPLDPQTRECGRRGVQQARDALEHPVEDRGSGRRAN